MPNNSIHFKNAVADTRRGEQGFSLLELIIAMLIFVIVTGSIYGVMQVSLGSRSVVNEQVQLTKNARVAMNLIGRETYNAGNGYPVTPDQVVLPDNRISTLIGIPNDADTSRDTVPPIIAGNGITRNNLDGIAGAMTDQVTFFFKDSTFNPVGRAGATAEQMVSQPLSINAATTPTTGIDEIVPISGSNTVCRKNDIYLVRGNSSATLALSTGLNGTSGIQFANGDVLGFNQAGAGNPLSEVAVSGAGIVRVKMVTYMVTADGVLTRREFANVPPVGTAAPAKFADEPLVYGVENFQIQYILDNGSITDDPGAGAGGSTVRQIRFTISLKSTGRDATGQPYRETMTSTFSTRNLGYDAN